MVEPVSGAGGSISPSHAEAEKVYGEEYFREHLGPVPYGRDQSQWVNFFSRIADEIVRSLRPRTVLDVGCAVGMLVEALWRRGVRAYGIDISQYAINQVPRSLERFCRVSSASAALPEDFPKRYDLVTCIEVLEHLSEQEAQQAIKNMAAVTKCILFSSTPRDVDEPTHVNVRPVIYWLRAFADHEFFPDPGFDASFVSPQAFLLRKTKPRVVDDFLPFFAAHVENRLSAIDQHREHERRLHTVQSLYETQLAELKSGKDWLEQALAQSEARIRSLEEALSAKEELITALKADLELLQRKLAESQNRVRSLEETVAAKDADARQQQVLLEQTVAALRERTRLGEQALQQLALIEGSVGWRLVVLLRRMRLRVIPQGSRQEHLWLQMLRFSRLCLEVGLREAVVRVVRRLRHALCESATGFVRELQGWIMGRVARERRLQTVRILRKRSAIGPPLARAKRDVRHVRFFHVSGIAPPRPLQPHRTLVQIVVCVHNALADVKECLTALVTYTRPPYTLLLVDDGSDPETARYVADFAESQGAQLIRNDLPRGYCRAANQALRITAADYVVLLNSDTVVTPGWLDRLVACAESDAKIGIVGPLSNAASWQSVPHVFNTRGDDWACNALPPGMSAADYSRLIARYSGQVYPRIPFLNGFCLMMKRKVIEDIGYFDEEVFREGYGEENDYCMRARNAGWELAVADDAYVFHAQSRSYSHDRRKVLVRRSDEALVRRYGAEAITRDVVTCRFDRVLEGVRARCGAGPSRMQWVEKGQSRFEGRRVLFILYDTMPGGGGHVVLQEAKAMLDMGVDVRVVNLARHREMFERSYPERTVPVVYVEWDHDIQGLLWDYDAVVGTFYASLEWIGPLQPQAVAPVRGYYIQDFEPFFFAEDSREYRKALESYTRYPDLVRFTKTEWNRQVVKDRTGADSVVVGPSVDIDAFRPRRRRDGDWPLRPLRVAAMVRPATPRRRPDLTMRVLERLYLIHGDNIQICIFGSRPDDPGFLSLPHTFPCWHAGVLTRDELAGFFNEVDVFADFSSWQAMGLSIMQAMACGVAVVAPRQGGAGTVVSHEENGLLVDSSSEEECLEALNRLVIDERLRGELQRRAIYDICQYPPERAAYAVLDALFSAQR